MSQSTSSNAPKLRDVEMHLLRPKEPGVGIVRSNEICTPSRKAAGFVRHMEIDLSGTPLAGRCVPGQSLGVIPPGTDERGRGHKVRLYSLASPSRGSDGNGQVHELTVKRVLDEHWDTHALFAGVASNFLCDCQVGDELQVTGPAGKRFVLPEDTDAHEYLFMATGTGIAPFRGMVIDLLEGDFKNRVTLIMGAPYSTDLIYHSFFLEMEERYENFTYLTAISRESVDGLPGMYVQDALDVHREVLLPQLSSERNLIYVCGIAGMELGILQRLATGLPESAREQYLEADPEALADIGHWTRRMIHKQIRPTRRVMLEVYS